MSPRETFHALTTIFPYYHQQAVNAFYKIPYGYVDTLNDQGLLGEAMRFRQQFGSVFISYETAMRCSKGGKFSIADAAGERLLQGVLKGGAEEEEKKPFPLFKLPAESRNNTCEMVFQYPETGFHRRRFGGGGDVLENPPKDDQSIPTAWNNAVEDNTALDTASVKGILSPLLVSCQLLEESLPYFYNINTFYFPDVDELGLFLVRLPPKHLQQITSLCFTYSGHETTDVRPAFEQLRSLGKLRKLTSRIDEVEWVGRRRRRPRKKYQSATRMPGLNILEKIRGMKEVVFDRCPNVEEMLKEKMIC